MKTFLPFLVLFCIGISCSDTAVEPNLKVSVSTESTTAIEETWAMINITNGTSRNVYFTHTSNRIGFWTLEKAFKNSWIDVSTDTSFCHWLPTIQKVKLAPNEVYHDSVLILRTGRYRMGFPFTWDENETEPGEGGPPEEFVVE
jgi:hypothetical protein